MSIRTITLTVELDDEQQSYDVAVIEMDQAEGRLRRIFQDQAKITVMEFTREANPQVITHWTTGPELRQAVEARCFTSDNPGSAKYEYIGGDGRKAPEYEATRIRLRAFHIRMSVANLDQLATALETIPGCLSAVKVPDHPTLRPQVVAVFDRRVAP